MKIPSGTALFILLLENKEGGRLFKQRLKVFCCYLIGLFFLFSPGRNPRAEEIVASADEVSSPGVYVFQLKLVEKESPQYYFPEIPKTEVEFKKEPDLGKGKIYRKVFQFGKDHKTLLPFAWNKTTGKLFLDFNANYDLTDDLNNVFLTTQKRYSQIFKRVPIRVMIKGVPVNYHVDMEIMDKYGFRSSFWIPSSWKGEIDLPNLQAEIIVKDILDGEISISPKGSSYRYENDIYHLKPLSLKDRGTPISIEALQTLPPLPITDKIHIDNFSYAMSFEFVKKGEEIVLNARFQEAFPETGTVRLSGQFIKQIILFGEYQVFLFFPSLDMKLPAGNYSHGQICLQKSSTGFGKTGNMDRVFTVNPGQRCELKVGGPLKSSIKITKRGDKHLDLEYVTLGIGNEVYGGMPGEKVPSFEVYKGERKIFSDKFSLG